MKYCVPMMHPEQGIECCYRNIRHVSKPGLRGIITTRKVLCESALGVNDHPLVADTHVNVIVDVLQREVSCADILLTLGPPLGAREEAPSIVVTRTKQAIDGVSQTTRLNSLSLFRVVRVPLLVQGVVTIPEGTVPIRVVQVGVDCFEVIHSLKTREPLYSVGFDAITADALAFAPLEPLVSSHQV